MQVDIKELQPYELYGLLKMDEVFNEHGISVPLPLSKEDIYKRVKDIYYEKTSQIMDDKNQLYAWLKENNRFMLLNDLIRNVLSELVYGTKENEYMCNKKDLFLFMNLKSLLKIIYNHTLYCYKIYHKQDTTLSKLTKDEIEYYTRNILGKISLEWLRIFDNTVKEKNVIYIDEFSDKERKEYFSKYGIDEESTNFVTKIDGKYTIFITRTFTINDVISIIHEFTHYLNYTQNNKKIPRILSEFYSIFFEKYASLSLLKYGYSRDEIDVLNTKRLDNTIILMFEYWPVVNYFINYLENGVIDKNSMIVNEKKRISKFLTTIPEDIKYSVIQNFPETLNAEKCVCERCDRCTMDLIINPDIIYNSYPYIIGHFLSSKVIDKITHDPLNADKILTTIRLLAERKIEMDTYDIFLLCGVNNEEFDIKRECKNLDDENVLKRYNTN